MDRDECLHAEARPFAVSNWQAVHFDSGGGGRWAFVFLVEKVKAKAASFSFSAATGPKGGRTHDDGLCFRANAAHSWQTSLSSLRNALFPLAHPWWWAQPTVHAPGGHQHGLHRGRPSRARFLLDFDQDIRSDLQRWVPSACAKCLLQRLLDCKQLERQKAEPLHFNKHSHRSALVRRGRRSAEGRSVLSGRALCCLRLRLGTPLRLNPPVPSHRAPLS